MTRAEAKSARRVNISNHPMAWHMQACFQRCHFSRPTPGSARREEACKRAEGMGLRLMGGLPMCLAIQMCSQGRDECAKLVCLVRHELFKTSSQQGIVSHGFFRTLARGAMCHIGTCCYVAHTGSHIF